MKINDTATSPWWKNMCRTLLGIGFATLLLPVGSLAAQTTQKKVTYYYTDPQGTVLATADEAGNVTATSDYRPYGVQALGTPEAAPGYTGHVNDPGSGFVYMQARYYDSSSGRFVSVDPKSPSAGSVTAFSRYSYANSNPVNNIDPDGQEAACVNQPGHCSGNSEASKAAAQSLSEFGIGAGKAIVNGLMELDASIQSGTQESSSLESSNAEQAGGMIAGAILFEAAKSVATEGRSSETLSAGKLYHYTDAAGAAAIKASGRINADSAGRVFLTTDRISAKDANNALFMGLGGSKGTHVVEVDMKVGAELKSGTQPNELIHPGTIRDGRQADITVKNNDY